MTDITLRPGEFTLSIGIDNKDVLTFDRSGRPVIVFLDKKTYKRGLDNRVLMIRGERKEIHSTRARRFLDKAEREDFYRIVRKIITEAGEKYRMGEARIIQSVDGKLSVAGLHEWLDLILSLDPPVLEKDRDRFLDVYRPIGILPPDQYLSVILQGTEGCSHNRCSFCDFYRDIDFRIKSLEEFIQHIKAVKDFIGPAIGQRRSIFFADANAMVIPQEKLIPMMEVITAEFPFPGQNNGTIEFSSGESLTHRFLGINSFIDSFSGPMKEIEDFSELKELFLRRLYLGLESGSDNLLRFLDKPGTSRDALKLVRRIKKAGISVGVIVMAGIGGEKYALEHIDETVALIKAMELGMGDILYISDFLIHPDSEYMTRSAAKGLKELDFEGVVAQRETIADALLSQVQNRGFQIAPYSIQDFIY
jgi:radical SAM superfamily enzyme YgiQ (UPF0313 family)